MAGISTRAVKSVDVAPGFRFTEKPKAIEVMGLIDGKVPDSIIEWRFYLALIKHHLQYEYQYPLMGGKSRRGGFSIDFVVYSPFPVPVFLNGRYWHSGYKAAEDDLAMQAAQQAFKQIPVVIWDDELESQAEADQVVRSKFA